MVHTEFSRYLNAHFCCKQQQKDQFGEIYEDMTYNWCGNTAGGSQEFPPPRKTFIFCISLDLTTWSWPATSLKRWEVCHAEGPLSCSWIRDPHVVELLAGGDDTPGETALVSVETCVAETLTEWASPGARRRWSDWRSGNSEGWPRKNRNPEKGVKTDPSLTLNTSYETL